MNAAKRARIMEAAESLFIRGRFHEVTMDDVAQTAGVGKGTIYRYFKDKDALFSEVALAGHDELCDMVRREGARTADFQACLVNVCRRVSGFFIARRQLMHMMQSEERRALWQRGESRALWQSRRTQLVDAVTEILELGLPTGQIRGDVPLRALATILLGMLRTRGRESRGSQDPRIDYEVLVDLFLNGASPESGSA